MSVNGFDQQRARFAWERIKHWFPDPKYQDDALRQYRTVVRGASLFVRQCGLLQAIAFWISKNKLNEDQHGKPPRRAEWSTVEDLMCWLKRCELTRDTCTSAKTRPSHPEEILGPLMGYTADEVLLLEIEAIEFLGWLSRLTEAQWNALPAAPNTSHQKQEGVV